MVDNDQGYRPEKQQPIPFYLKISEDRRKITGKNFVMNEKIGAARKHKENGEIFQQPGMGEMVLGPKIKTEIMG